MYLSSISKNGKLLWYLHDWKTFIKETGNEVYANLKQANKIHFFKGKKIYLFLLTH